MARIVRVSVLAFVALLALPSVALAEQPAYSSVPGTIPLLVNAIGLIVAVVLLIGALRFRSVVSGGAMAEKMYLVFLAIVCLTGAAIAQWALNFMPSRFTVEETQLAAEILEIVAMGLLAAYFHSVYYAMHGYMKAMTGGQRLAEESQESAESDVDQSNPGG